MGNVCGLILSFGRVKPHEEVVNVCFARTLGRILGKRSVVIPERVIPKGRKRFDVRIDYKGVEFIVEASYDGDDAIEDARKRVEEGLINTVAIALHYDSDKLYSARTPEEIETVLLEADFGLKIFSLGSDISNSLIRYISGKVRIAKELTRNWIRARADEFPQVLDSVIEFLVSEDILVKLADEIEQRTNEFIDHVSLSVDQLPKLAEKFKKNLYLVLFSSSGKDEDAIIPDVPQDVAFAHTYISLLMASLLYDSVAPGHGLDSMYRVLSKNKGHPLLAMKDAFTKIIEIDYEPVFDIALALIDYLFDLQTNTMVMQDLRDLIESVQHIIINRAVLRSDFIGKVYHKVTGNIAIRKGYATFYTKAPIAYFLAYIALHSLNDKWKIDWKDLKSLSERFKVCDFSCGSGTLLSASYAALQTLYRKACFDEEDQPNLLEFHKKALEDCIWGFDALEHAAQTASVVLSLHERGVPLNKMRMYHVPVDRTGSQGSLNFWWADRQLVPISRRGVEGIGSEEVVLSGFDLIIMNPPFSRATAPGREGSRPRIFDFISSQVAFERLWTAYTRLIRDIEKGLEQNKVVNSFRKKYVGKNLPFMKRNVDPLYAGAALPFFFLADRYLKKGGRLALVLPRTTLESSSFFLLRSALIAGYDIEYIVISSEEGNPNFSYSAQLSEALVVARKIEKERDLSESKTCIVNFRKQPKDVLSGLLAAKNVLDELSSKGEKKLVRTQYAEVKMVNRNVIEEFVWNLAPILGLPPFIEKTIGQLVEGKLFGLPLELIRVMDLPDFSITNPRKFRGTQFSTKYIPSDTGNLRFLNRTGKKVVNKLKFDLSNTISISPQNSGASLYYQKAGGRLLVPEAIRFNTTPLIATWSPDAIVSSRTHILRADINLERALCAWMNSTFGIIWLRTLFTTLEEKFGHIYGWHLRILRVPDLREPAISKQLNRVFDAYSQIDWCPLPEQYERVKSGADLTRLNYDLDIIRALSKAAGSELDEKEAKIVLRALYSEIARVL